MKYLLTILMLFAVTCYGQIMPNEMQWLSDAAALPRGSAAGSQIPTNGLISYWSFNGDANDNFGTNNGTATAATLTNGVKGTALTAYYFNGSSAFINVGDVGNLSFTSGGSTDTAFSVSAWMKQADSNNMIFTKIEKDASAEYQCNVYLGQFNLSLFTDTGKRLTNTSSNIMPSNVWVHYVATYSGNKLNSGIILYTNGVVCGSFANNDGVYVGMNNGTDKVQIGARAFSSSRFFASGVLDEMRVYGRVLTPTEVTAIYNEE